ncbi:ABC transporter substrate-binding protein [Candidatus Poribacteria bacterium]|nr:ABC transporter substrate-binding protein [Candidatus Poribacteria bacterium]
MKIRTTTMFVVLVVFVAMLSFSSCENVSNIIEHSKSQGDDSGEHLAIGVVLPLTGRHMFDFGEPVQQGLELALNEINDGQLAGTHLTFVVADSGSTVEGAVAAYNKLIHEDGVSVLLGPATSSMTKEAFPVAQENQVVAISPTSAARDLSAIGDYVFRIALTTDKLIPNGIAATHAKLAYQNVATLYDEDDAFSRDGDAAVQEALAELNVNVLITEKFKSGDTDFTEQLTRIKALNPDAIFLSSLSQEKPPVLIQAQELGITAQFIIRTFTENNVAASGDAAEGAITFVGWGKAVDTQINQEFIKNYSDAYGINPNNYVARAYTALHVLAEGIRNAASHAPKDIRDALAQVSDFETVFGAFSFDEVGDAVYEPKILIVKNGKLELFE